VGYCGHHATRPHLGAGDEPRLHKLQFNFAKTLAAMMPSMFEERPEMREMKYEMIFALTDWTTGDEVSTDRFAFSKPQGAEKVESMDAMLARFEEMMEQPVVPASELLGKQAPAFDAPLFDGATVTAAQHKGRDIVILDFWATWCVPCVEALPDLMAVAEAYKDRNVVLYAVQVYESSKALEKFFEQRNWDLKVPMDRDGSIARSFKVSGIPQTVIIDKDGTVQAVHVGAVPKAVLEHELDTLLRGEKLSN
jgi:peroxiredoxin